ncbi:putative branched-chain amino acid transport permease [Pusillimonas sp. T7-7]|uniref:branched-chain amino acid ABC transporter permease n=1 Tax=Pusillimonas sp. (strain T7-7) TaxID=1007105 RepID=UPI0002084376|nr:branched-chain amino acid ABC transporter permease [Pusillimonas sp. T7-7]AEC21471.1 putative branched-chain amino acid transport permease [Pusillimonas sp. T7-7]
MQQSLILPRKWSASFVVNAVLLIALALVPLYARSMADPFVVTLITRILIFAIAALSLNLILGYGGLVSFGHALYLGLGVYCAAIPSFHGMDNGWLQLLATLAVCGMVGLLTGSIALRTSGISFIMITLAFAQMFYFLFVSLSQYGGDDGLRLASGSNFSGIVLTDPRTLYFVAFLVLCLSLYACHRLVHSRFGIVIRASKSNEQRMKALGYPTYRYRLAVYVVSAILCGIAGLLYGNLTQFGSPSYMSWTTSGELIVMVMLGGIGTLFGPLLGALAMILTEEGLKALTEHWMAIFGPLIVIIIIVSRLGIAGILQALDRRRAQGRNRLSGSRKQEST